MGSGLSYARRYAYAAIFGIAAEEDDDANAAQENARQVPQKPVETRKPEQPQESAASAGAAVRTSTKVQGHWPKTKPAEGSKIKQELTTRYFALFEELKGMLPSERMNWTVKRAEAINQLNALELETLRQDYKRFEEQNPADTSRDLLQGDKLPDSYGDAA